MSNNQTGGRSRFNTEIDTAMRRMTSQSVLFSHAVAQVLGMHSTDLECLGFLVDEGRVTAGRLADLTGLTTGAATRMIDRLERAGYVRREYDASDRRRVMVSAVPERVAEVIPMFASLKRCLDDLSADYSDKELDLILDFLNRASQSVQEHTAALRQRLPDSRP